MMYVVTYTLNPPRPMPQPMTTAIQSVGQWWHYLDNTWILMTSESATEVWNRIAPTITTEDRVLIAQITANAGVQGWLPRDAWDWIHARRYL